MNKILATPGGSGLLAGFCWLSPLFLPLLAPLQLLVPLPLLLTALRQGERYGWLASSIPLFLATLLTGNVLGSCIAYLFLCGIPLLLAGLLYRGWKVSQGLILTFLMAAVLMFLVLTILSLLNFDMVTTLERSLDHRIEPTRELLLNTITKSEGMNPRNVALFKEELQQMIHLMARIFPVLGLGGWFLVLSGNLLATRQLLLRNQDPFQTAQEDLTTFRAPFFLVWPLIISTTLAIFSTGNGRFLGLNLGLFLAIPSLFQGLAVVQWSFRKYGVSTFMQGFFYVILLLWIQVILLVTVLGLLDNWFDFRKRYLHGTEEKNSSGE
ncbi:MAG: YybS family protein [Magnetococcus sp. DMHC-1]|nr:DUF2232 domain-containing protein [Magnetococcales bacterium]